jgi:hypothetical protein
MRFEILPPEYKFRAYLPCCHALYALMLTQGCRADGDDDDDDLIYIALNVMHMASYSFLYLL